MDKTAIEEMEEKNLDENIDTWTQQKTIWDRSRRGRNLQAVGHLKDEIIQLRMAYHDHDLKGWTQKIEALQDERTLALQAPMDKVEFLSRVKELVHDRKKEALNQLVLLPLAVTQAGNRLPTLETTRELPERHIWSLLYLAITDEDLEAVVASLPEIGCLSNSERKTKVAEINAEIAKLTEALESKRAEAEQALKAAAPK